MSKHPELEGRQNAHHYETASETEHSLGSPLEQTSFLGGQKAMWHVYGNKKKWKCLQKEHKYEVCHHHKYAKLSTQSIHKYKPTQAMALL